MPERTRAARGASKSKYPPPEPVTPPARSDSPGSFDITSVQDRIGQWQAQGASRACAPDALSLCSGPMSEVEPDLPSATGRELAPEDADKHPEDSRATGSKGGIKRWVDKESRAWVREAKSASTPRKRVISDDHWKTSKAWPSSTPRGSRPKEDVTPANQSQSPSDERRKEREERRRQRRESRKSQYRQHETGAGDDSKELKDSTRLHYGETKDEENELGMEKTRRGAGLIGKLDMDPGVSQDPSNIEIGDNADRTARSRYAKTLGQPSVFVNDDTSSMAMSKTGRIFKKTKEMFSKSEAIPIVNSSLPSIEAWLYEQPDPFVSGDDSGVIPAPLQIRGRKKEVLAETPLAGNNSLLDYSLEDDALDRDLSSTLPNIKDRTSRPLGARAPRLTTDTGLGATTAGNRESGKRDVQWPPETIQKSRRSSSPSFQSVTRRNKAQSSTRLPLRPGQKDIPAYDQIPPPYEESRIGVQQPFSEALESRGNTDEVEICGVKRKLTTHEDLLSVLSRPRRSRTTKSSRRDITEKKGEDSSAEILMDLTADEEKYSRELQTLVDGVIPVLLQSFLSKSASSATSGLFGTSASASDDMNYVRPIVDMGVALERLKSCHTRIPLQSLDALLSWGQTSQKAYSDYLNAWRLGFQDIVVNLAPFRDGDALADGGMARDDNGDVIDSQGKKADVAYLLKRPLVRAKNLSKTFCRVDRIVATARSKKVIDLYEDLTALARKRFQEEQGRIEDETAANIDTSKARDLRTLTPSADTSVDKQRRVRARDCFNLSLYHTTRQCIDCRVEMVLRDNDRLTPAEGDVLISETGDSGKWLLFSPANIKSVSARKGDRPHELVVMVRGHKGGQDWHELLALRADDNETVEEWLSMLGSNPLPPKLERSPTSLDTEIPAPVDVATLSVATSAKSKHAAPSLQDLGGPIGAPSDAGMSRGARIERSTPARPERYLPKLNLGGGLQAKSPRTDKTARRETWHKPESSNATISSGQSSISTQSLHTLSSGTSVPSTTNAEWLSDFRKANAAKKNSKGLSRAAQSPEEVVNSITGIAKPQTPPKLSRIDLSSEERLRNIEPASKHRLVDQSASQWKSIPFIPNDEGQATSTETRSDGSNTHYKTTPLNESIHDQWAALSAQRKIQSAPTTPIDKRKKNVSRPYIPFTEDIPPPPAHPQRPRDFSPRIGIFGRKVESPPPPPPHGSPIGARSVSEKIFSVPPPVMSPVQSNRRERGSSSPLKKEYAPSTASDSPNNSDSEDLSDVSSETSEEFASEADDKPTPLVSVRPAAGRRLVSDSSGFLRSTPSSQAQTLAPSDSASQGPYRSVPPTTSLPSSQKGKAIAMVCSWTDSRGWDQLHPDECSIVVSPGLIEAYEMSAAHSGGSLPTDDRFGSSAPTAPGDLQPLVAFELTPLVMLHRGAAIDVSFRSPPTANSRLKSTSNVMFRCRSPVECERLYSMINWARVNNPTYIALERARPKIQPKVTFAVDNSQENRTKAAGSWFSFGGSQKRSSYRASSGPVPQALSNAGASEASVMSLASGLLKRFNVNPAFNLHRSALVQKSTSQGTGSSSLSSSTGQTQDSTSTSPAPSQLGVIPGKDGPSVPSTSAEAANGGGMVNNMKIRLYLREISTNWADLGAARLTIMPPPAATRESIAGTAASARAPGQTRLTQSATRGPSSTHTPHRIHNDGREKRVLVSKNKHPDVLFIDRVLGESCFERIAQCGIAVNVWTESESIATFGGVAGGRNKTYMLQFPGAKEAAWVFGIVGTYRYE